MSEIPPDRILHEGLGPRMCEEIGCQEIFTPPPYLEYKDARYCHECSADWKERWERALADEGHATEAAKTALQDTEHAHSEPESTPTPPSDETPDQPKAP